MKRPSSGFSLIEVLIAMLLTVGAGAAVFHMFRQNERLFRDQNLIMEMHQTARVVASQIADDVRVAGQGLPPGMPFVLPGSGSSRLNLRGSVLGIVSFATAGPELSFETGVPLSLPLDSVAGFNPGRYVHLWTPLSRTRALVDSVSQASSTLRLVPVEDFDPFRFESFPIVSPDDAVAVYRDAASRVVRRTTATGMTSPDSPIWAPANELALNVVTLEFAYYDRRGNPLLPETSAGLSQVASIDIRLAVSTAGRLSDGTQPVFGLSLRATPRNSRDP